MRLSDNDAAGGSSFNAGANIAFTGTNTHAGTETFNGEVDINQRLTIGSQAIALNGASQTASATAGNVYRVTGSTASSTVLIPGSLPANTLLIIDNEATVGWTLGTVSGTIDGAATVPMTAGVGRLIFYNGTNFTSVNFTKVQADALYSSLAGTNVFAGSNTFNGPQLFGRQSFSANGTISAAGGSVVEYTGSTGSQTVNLPASPTAGLAYEFANNSSVSVTLSGNGLNIDGAASVSIPTLGAVQLTADSGGWHSSSLNQQVGDGRYGKTASTNTWTSLQTLTAGATANGTLTASSTFSIAGRWTLSAQSLTTNGGSQSIASTAGSAATVLITGSTASSTFTLPGSPSSGMAYVVKNASSVSITLSGNGNNIEGSASLTLTAGQSRWIRYNGTQWDILGGYL